MYVYVIGSGDYSDYREIHLLHKKKMSEKKFKKLFNKSADAAMKKQLAKGDPPEYTSINAKRISNQMCKKYGFKLEKEHVYVKISEELYAKPWLQPTASKTYTT
jgi:hypothetical protein